MCSKHFVSGRASGPLKSHDLNWVPSLNLGHRKLLSGEKLRATLESSAKREGRVMERAMKREAMIKT